MEGKPRVLSRRWSSRRWWEQQPRPTCLNWAYEPSSAAAQSCLWMGSVAHEQKKVKTNNRNNKLRCLSGNVSCLPYELTNCRLSLSDFLTKTSPRSFLQTCSLPTGLKESAKTLSWGCSRSLPSGGEKTYHKQQNTIKKNLCLSVYAAISNETSVLLQEAAGLF